MLALADEPQDPRKKPTDRHDYAFVLNPQKAEAPDPTPYLQEGANARARAPPSLPGRAIEEAVACIESGANLEEIAGVDVNVDTYWV